LDANHDLFLTKVDSIFMNKVIYIKQILIKSIHFFFHLSV